MSDPNESEEEPNEVVTGEHEEGPGVKLAPLDLCDLSALCGEHPRASASEEPRESAAPASEDDDLDHRH